MRRNIFPIIIAVMCALICQGAQEPISPSSWPPTVTTQSDFTDGNKQIPAGTIATLHRVEGDKIIATAGRYGPAEIPIALTDFTQQAAAIRSGKMRKAAPNLITRIGNKCFRQLENGQYQGLPESYFKNTKQLLLYFAAGNSPQHDQQLLALNEAYRHFKKTHSGFEVIMIQTDPSVFATEHKPLIIWPTMAFHMSQAYKDSLRLGQAQAPSMVLVGVEGDRLLKSETFGASISEFMKQVEPHLLD